jgi:hypothetical protein
MPFSKALARDNRQAEREGRMNVTFIDDADHTFSRSAPRWTLIQAISKHRCRRYLESSD